MRFWLQSSVKSFGLGPSAISIVAHVALIGASVRGTAINARDLKEAMQQVVAYQPPPDRRGSRENVVEHLEYIDIGGGLPMPEIGTGDQLAQGGPLRSPKVGGDAGQDPRAQEKSAAEPSPDSVYSVLEVEERAVRTANSAAPEYPAELMKDGTEGRVLIRFVVDTTGHADPSTIEIIRSTHAAFSASVRAAVPLMSFTPAMVDGRRVRQAVEQNFEFRISIPTPAEQTRIEARSLMQSEFGGFSPAARRFLGALARNNNREWFEKNRPTYELELRAPLAALVEEMDVRLATIAPEIVGNPKSLFRIHRDVRFSNDKSPYKTNVACWFFHSDAGRGVGASTPHGGAGFYFHMEAKRASIGAGIWMPPRPTLQKLRDVIAENHKPLAKILNEPALKRRFGTLDEENMLTRMPRGFAETHPAATLLRHQSYTVGRELSDREVHSAKLPDLLARDYALMLPLVRWLNGALGLRTLARR